MALCGSCIGVNWGKITSHPLPDDKVVDMIVANGFKSVKLFDVDDSSMKALMGRDVQVMIALPNAMMQPIAQNPKLAAAWVRANVTKYVKPGGANIKYVAVGNEPFLAAYKGKFVNVTLPALKNIQQALDDAKLGSQIKATVPCNADVLMAPGPPSTGYFRPDISDIMVEMLKFLSESKAPFTVNIYPFLDVYLNPGFPFDFAFFDGASTPLQDGDLSYNNVLDSSIDTLICGMEKAGYGDVPIIVGEVGWPTDGVDNANIENAKRFNQGLVQRVASDEGTPKRKGKLNVYMFSLMDEDMKSTLPGNFETHWGIFGANGQPKYDLDVSGRKRSNVIVGVKGVKPLGKTWCVVKSSKVENQTLLAEAVAYACQNADCTALTTGSSCYNFSLSDKYANATYAFNQYYQGQNQQVSACVFNGMATVTDKDPSTGTCIFPVTYAYDGPIKNSTVPTSLSTNSSAPTANSPAADSDASSPADSDASDSSATPTSTASGLPRTRISSGSKSAANQIASAATGINECSCLLLINGTDAGNKEEQMINSKAASSLPALF
ncbi:hypothetical protein ACLOJK_020393 [Asimina triloba]